METERLPAPGADDGELDRLVAECVERFETEGPGAIEDVCRAHPEQEAALRRRLDFLESAGLLAVEVDDGHDFPERLGDFRLIEPLGGGGMGIVYLAHEESLGREVALKLVRPEQLYFPGSRERFEREVLTVAQLHHPGIVPVYSVGEQDGVPYFAMERVRGCTLAEVLGAVAGRRPGELTGADFERAIADATQDDGTAPGSELFRGTWEETCLRVVREVCEALEHAHRRGVLHRDLKPSNIMVTRAGRVLLLDFGLTSTEGADRLTRSGSQVGSLPYLPPDYLTGGHPGPSVALDLYSIGVTLYELLTLELPFAAPTATELQQRILDARPRALRSLNPRATWEAETVCQRAMDADPLRRYATAADLARDISNVLEHRPIEARRAGTWLRVRRWAQRRPASAVGAVLGTLLVVGGPTAFAILEARHSERVTGINERLVRSLQEEEHQRARAESNFDRALGAVDRMLARVGSHELAGLPETLPVRTALMDDAIELFRSLARDNGTDAELRERIADALLRLAAFSGAQQQYERSEASVRAQIDIDRTLAAESADLPARAGYLARVARGLSLLGQLLALQDRVAEAIESTGEAVELMYQAVERGSGPETERTLAHTLSSLAQLQYRDGQVEAALARYEEAAGRCSELLATGPPAWEVRYELTRALNGQGALSWDLGRFEDAEPALRAAAALQEELLAEDGSERVKLSLVDTLHNLASLIVEAHEDPQASAEAEELLRRALGLQGEIVASTPSYTAARNALHDMQTSLARHVGRDPARVEEATALLRTAEAGQRSLVAAEPGISEYHSDLATALATLGDLQRRAGDTTGAATRLERAIAEAHEALTLDPRNPQYTRQLAFHHLDLADVHLARSAHTPAAEATTRALDLAAPDARVVTRSVRTLAHCADLAASDPTTADNYARTAAKAVRRAREAGTLETTVLDAPEYAGVVESTAYREALDD